MICYNVIILINNHKYLKLKIKFVTKKIKFYKFNLFLYYNFQY